MKYIQELFNYHSFKSQAIALLFYLKIKMIKKLDGVFSSPKLEQEFKDKQLGGILLMHRTFSIFLLFVYIAVLIDTATDGTGDFITPIIVVFLGILTVGQLVYFHKNPNYKALTCLNVSNVLIALFDYYGVYEVQNQSANQPPALNVTDEFFWGAAFFAIHFSLLVNPCLSQNVIVISAIYTIHTVYKALTNGPFHYFSIVLLLCIGLYLQRMNIELKMKRQLFIMKKEKSEWENIIKVLIDYPYLILSFNQDEHKFVLTEANPFAQSELKISDSLSLRSVLREMDYNSKTCQKIIKFESQLYNLTKQIELQEIDGNTQYDVRLGKMKYVVQVFLVEQQSKSFLITFKNISRTIFHESQSQIIINQQIACCNFANQQLKLCKSLIQSLKKGDKSQCSIAVEKNIFETQNFMGIFRKDHKINLRSYNIRNQIKKMCRLFPKVTFYLSTGYFRCKSDPLVLQSVFYNALFVLQKSKNIFIDIKRDLNTYAISFIARPVNKQTFRLLEMTQETELGLSHLNKVNTQWQQAFLMLKKNLSIISPFTKIELNHLFDDCKFYMFISRIPNSEIQDLLRLGGTLVKIIVFIISNIKFNKFYFGFSLQVYNKVDFLYLNLMIKRFDGVFLSDKLEDEYQEQQLEGILKFHRIFQLVSILGIIFLIVNNILEKDYVLLSISFIYGLLCFALLIYFQKYPSNKCMACINISNIIVALLGLYSYIDVVKPHNPIDPNDNWVWGAAFYTFHLSLLVNPRLSTNIFVMALIVMIHGTILSLVQGSFHYFSIILIIFTGFYLSKLNIELQLKRKLFVMKKEKLEWENIVKDLIDDPYIILNYNQNDLKFHLTEANSLAQSDLNISDSLTMRLAFRELINNSEKTKIHINFENQLVHLVKHQQEIQIDRDREYILNIQKIKYLSKVFVIESETNTLLITFKNLNRIIFNQTSKQIIINQQIACCNLANSQLKLCKSLNKQFKNGNTKYCNISVQRNIFVIQNFNGIFRANPEIVISSFDLRNNLKKMCKLFPKVSFYMCSGMFRCKSDIIAFQSMMFNVFYVLQNSKNIFIDIERGRDVYNLSFLARPVNNSTFRLLNQFKEIELQSHLNKVNKQKLQAILMLKKNLVMLAPNIEIELSRLFDDCKIQIYQRIPKAQTSNLLRFNGTRMNRYV